MQRTWYTLGLYRSPDTSFSGGGGTDLMDDDGDDNGSGTDENEESTDDDEEEEADAGGSDSTPRPGPPLGDKLNEIVNNEGKSGERAPNGEQPGGGEGVSALDSAAAQLFGVKDGLIQFDGEDAPVPFSSLSADDQADVLAQHARNQQAQQPTAAERALLSEIQRTGGVDNWARQQAAALSAQPVTALSDEQVNLRDIQQRYPKFTQEQQQAELESRKGNPLFRDKTDIMREQQTGQEQQAQQLAARQENEQVAQDIIGAARGMSEIDGFVMSPDILNNVLEDLLEADEGQADSRFLLSLDDPREMIRTRFWSKYGPALVEEAEKRASGGTSRKTAAGAQTSGVKGARHVPPTAAPGKNKGGGGTDLME